jgi:hypothetical protein
MSDDFPEATEEKLFENLLAGGWRWSDSVPRVLFHPDDPEYHLWKHPDTGDLNLSDRLVAWLVEDVARVRAGRERSHDK